MDEFTLRYDTDDKAPETAFSDDTNATDEPTAPAPNTAYQPRFAKPESVSDAPEPERPARDGKSKGIFIGILAAALIALAIGGYLLFTLLIGPSLRYSQAKKALEAGDYEAAIEGFADVLYFKDSREMLQKTNYAKAGKLHKDAEYDRAEALYLSLGDYEDSAVLAKQTRYDKAAALLEQGAFDESYRTFRSLEDFEDSQDMLIEVDYRRALAELDAGNYEEAYSQLTQHKNYDGAQEALAQCVGAWLQEALSDESEQLPKALTSVRLSEAMKSRVYEVLLETVEENSGRSADEWKSDVLTEKLIDGFSMLPAGYEARNEYLTLLSFLDLREERFLACCQNNETLVPALWDTSLLRQLFCDSDIIYDFLIGKWKTEDAAYSLEFTENYKGSNNLPKPERASSVTHFDINDYVYVWEDDDNFVIEEVFRIQLLDPDTIEITCCVDESTYTMTRQ